jgi:hypothetical protein
MIEEISRQGNTGNWIKIRILKTSIGTAIERLEKPKTILSL